MKQSTGTRAETDRLRDFDLQMYRRLCEALVAAGYQAWSIARYLEAGREDSICELPRYLVLLRHDIDRRPGTAVRMATLEHELGLEATYYARVVPGVFRPSVLSRLAALGHEVGFHYETLSKCGGDFERAIDLFRKDLSRLRQVSDVRTISMHGRPLSPHNNRDLWQKADYRTLGLVGEAYLSIDYQDVAYFTDTGRAWNDERHNLRDRVPGSLETTRVGSTIDLIALVRSQTVPRLCISAHPNRWASNGLEWFGSLAWDRATNAGKRLVLLVRGARTAHHADGGERPTSRGENCSGETTR
jgi:hypothetical protein